jgi:hypothetical protein
VIALTGTDFKVKLEETAAPWKSVPSTRFC